jgi:glucose/arabinose dehydrogenase
MSLIEPPLSVSGGGNGPEAGFLSVAFHPQFAQNKLFYAFYTGNPGGKVTIDEFERLTPTTSKKTKTILDRPRVNPGPYHNGGSIYFSPKDAKPFIYLSLGDHQSPGGAASPMGLNGRILKIDPAVGMEGMTTAQYNIRNPYRMSIDRLTGDLWIGNVSGPPGGHVLFAAAGSPPKSWGHDNGGMSINGGNDGSGSAIIGGVVYRGKKIPGLCGRYFFGQHSSGLVKSLIQKGGMRVGAVETHPSLNTAQISSFGEDGEGEIWMSSRSANTITRIEAM